MLCWLLTTWVIITSVSFNLLSWQGCVGVKGDHESVMTDTQLTLNQCPFSPPRGQSLHPQRQFTKSMINTILVWIMFPQNVYVEALTPNVTAFEDRVFKETIKVKLGHNMIGLVLIRRWHQKFLSVSLYMNTEKRIGKCTERHLQARKWGLTRNQPEQHLDWIYSLQNWKKNYISVV